jgi:hypothetical protein
MFFVGIEGSKMRPYLLLQTQGNYYFRYGKLFLPASKQRILRRSLMSLMPRNNLFDIDRFFSDSWPQAQQSVLAGCNCTHFSPTAY